jgi:hypothetical protein
MRLFKTNSWSRVCLISSMKKQQDHIVLCPYPAQGHLLPFLSLATRLHLIHPDLTITLVSTPRHISSIRSSLPPDSRLHLHSLPFYPNHLLTSRLHNFSPSPKPLNRSILLLIISFLVSFRMHGTVLPCALFLTVS